MKYCLLTVRANSVKEFSQMFPGDTMKYISNKIMCKFVA